MSPSTFQLKVSSSRKGVKMALNIIVTQLVVLIRMMLAKLIATLFTIVLVSSPRNPVTYYQFQIITFAKPTYSWALSLALRFCS